MGLRKIVTVPDPVLRRKAHKVSEFDKDFKSLVEDMIDTMRDAPGVGLAAPQIAVPLRLVVVEFGKEDDDEAPKKLYVVANPEYVQVSENDTLVGVEACLSVTGLIGEVERYNQIVLKGYNRFGKPIKIKASGWLARIFQHEIDHLDGVLYTDRAIRIWEPKDDEELIAAD
jgi:peptide deformylase